MPDPSRDPMRAEIDRFIAEHGVQRVPRGVSGIFDEHGNYRKNPLRVQVRRMGTDRREAYRAEIEAGRSAIEIAGRLGVSEEFVRQMAHALGFGRRFDRDDGAPATPQPVVDNRKASGPAQAVRGASAAAHWTATTGALAAPPPPAETPEPPAAAEYRACHAAGMSTAGIAALRGVTEKTVRTWLARLGLVPNPPSHLLPNRRSEP